MRFAERPAQHRKRLRTRHGPELARAERERQKANTAAAGATPSIVSRKRSSDTPQSTLEAV